MTYDDYMKKIRNKDKNKEPKNYRKSIIKRTLITATICLIIMIICNLSSPVKKTLKKYIFETNYNFAKINSIYKKYLLDIKKKTGAYKTKPVSTNSYLEYKSYEEYMDGVMLEIEDSYNVKLLESGLIVFIGEKEGIGPSVVVQQSNGIDVIYGGVTANDIKVYDYIEKGNIIGTASKKLYLSFTKDGEILDYKTYIK